MIALKKTTVGTCNALIADQEEFNDFDGIDFHFFLNEKNNTWTINATTKANDRGRFQILTFRFHDDGDVVNKKYSLNGDPLQPNQAFASWAKTNGISYQFYNAHTGSMTVSINRSSKTVAATFDFEGTDRTENVNVTQGTLTLEGFTQPPEIDATGSVECAVSGSIALQFTSQKITVRPEAATDIFPAHIATWSQHSEGDSNPLICNLAIDFAEHLLPGTYAISPESQEVRVLFVDISDNYPCWGVSGTLKLESMLDPTFKGELSGTFSCRAVAGGTDYSVEIKNGFFKING